MLAALVVAIANVWNRLNVARQGAASLAGGSVQMNLKNYSLRPIGVIRSTLRSMTEAPKQGAEGGPDAWLEVDSVFAAALHGVSVADSLIVITWLHRADREVLEVHPRDNPSKPIRGVFATRSQDRPNPLGLHRVTVRETDGTRLRVGPIEAIDGTPVVDIKVALGPNER